MPTYYEILRIPQEASEQEIKQAYRRLALLLHPDKNTSSDAATRFKELLQAYTILSDPTLRNIYDRSGEIAARAAETGLRTMDTEPPTSSPTEPQKKTFAEKLIDAINANDYPKASTILGVLGRSKPEYAQKLRLIINIFQEQQTAGIPHADVSMDNCENDDLESLTLRLLTPFVALPLAELDPDIINRSLLEHVLPVSSITGFTASLSLSIYKAAQQGISWRLVFKMLDVLGNPANITGVSRASINYNLTATLKIAATSTDMEPELFTAIKDKILEKLRNADGLIDQSVIINIRDALWVKKDIELIVQFLSTAQYDDERIIGTLKSLSTQAIANNQPDNAVLLIRYLQNDCQQELAFTDIVMPAVTNEKVSLETLSKILEICPIPINSTSVVITNELVQQAIATNDAPPPDEFNPNINLNAQPNLKEQFAKIQLLSKNGAALSNDLTCENKIAICMHAVKESNPNLVLVSQLKLDIIKTMQEPWETGSHKCSGIRPQCFIDISSTLSLLQSAYERGDDARDLEKYLSLQLTAAKTDQELNKSISKRARITVLNELTTQFDNFPNTVYPPAKENTQNTNPTLSSTISSFFSSIQSRQVVHNAKEITDMKNLLSVWKNFTSFVKGRIRPPLFHEIDKRIKKIANLPNEKIQKELTDLSNFVEKHKPEELPQSRRNSFSYLKAKLDVYKTTPTAPAPMIQPGVD